MVRATARPPPRPDRGGQLAHGETAIAWPRAGGLKEAAFVRNRNRKFQGGTNEGGGSTGSTACILCYVSSYVRPAHRWSSKTVQQLGRRAGLSVRARTVSKARLDVSVLPSGESFGVSNDAASIEELCLRVVALQPVPVVLEATGGMESEAVTALAARFGTSRRRLGA
jgi:hypothetical protein